MSVDPDLFYRPSWTELEQSAGGEVPSGRWLVLAGADPAGEAVAEALRARGSECTLVRAGGDFGSDGGVVTLDPERLDHFERLVGEAGELAGIVHAWSCDMPAAEELTGESLHDAQALGCVSAIYLLRALAGNEASGRPRLCLVTRGAQPAPGGTAPVEVGQSPLWGFARVIAFEHAELRPLRLDLDPQRPAGEADALLATVARGDEEEELALRDGRLFALRLERMPVEDGAGPIAVEPDGTYLITGGLGGLGMTTAEWLVSRGARSLVLMSRRDPDSEEVQAQLEPLRSAGAHVEAARADASSEEQLAELIERIDRELPPLRGVAHSAGWLDDDVILRMDRDRFDVPMAGKAIGALNLHRLTRDRKLGFFLLYSSGAAILGNPGQASYAAANAFLDALAAHRRALGLPALSLNWGGWAEVGGAVRIGADRRLKRFGLGLIAPDEGMAAMEALMHDAPPQVAVVRVEWTRYLTMLWLGSPPPLVSALDS